MLLIIYDSNLIQVIGTSFFTARGIAAPFVTTVITDVVNVVSTLPGLYGIEKFGRRALLLWGAIGMLVCQFIVAAVGTALDTDAANKAFVAFICIYIFFFASTWGPIACKSFSPLRQADARLKKRSYMLTTNQGSSLAKFSRLRLVQSVSP